MSEYQYYEFKAIDRPLTDCEIQAIRRITTRAELTPTSFTNEYHWGDFKGDPLRMMEKYYDAFLYVANWGTHRFMLRLSNRTMRIDRVLPYRVKEAFDIHEKGKHLIFEFVSEEEPEEDVYDGAGWMGSLIPLREDLARGDTRCLYLAWLSAAQEGLIRKNAPEPPVPPGLESLSGPLEAFAKFMRVDQRLIRAAAAASERMPAHSPQRTRIQSWIRNLPEARKNVYLLKWLEGSNPRLRADVLEDFEHSTALRRPRKTSRSRKGGPSHPPQATKARRRTTGELFAAAGMDCPETR
jgi:hypothetical protein